MLLFLYSPYFCRYGRFNKNPVPPLYQATPHFSAKSAFPMFTQQKFSALSTVCCRSVNDRWFGLPVCPTEKRTQPFLTMLAAYMKYINWNGIEWNVLYGAQHYFRWPVQDIGHCHVRLSVSDISKLLPHSLVNLQADCGTAGHCSVLPSAVLFQQTAVK